MVLTTFCPLCEAENSFKSQGAVDRSDFVEITGSEMAPFKCKSCKQEVSVDINDVNAEEGYLMFYLIPVAVILVLVFRFFSQSSDLLIILAPLLGVSILIGRHIYNRKIDQVAEFNQDLLDRPARKIN